MRRYTTKIKFFFNTYKYDKSVRLLGIFMTGKFEVWTDKAGEFRFRLKAANGEIIATSEGYTSKDSCMNGIQSVINNAPDAEIVEISE